MVELGKAKKVYEKPVIVKQKKMVITETIFEAMNMLVCRQCSSCHGCR